MAEKRMFTEEEVTKILDTASKRFVLELQTLMSTAPTPDKKLGMVQWFCGEVMGDGQKIPNVKANATPGWLHSSTKR